MLACRQKVLANLKPYHKDVFAFNFVRLFLAGKNFTITQHEMFELCDLPKDGLLELILTNKISDSLRSQIGWYVAASYKAAILSYKSHNYYYYCGTEYNVYLTVPNKPLSNMPIVYSISRKNINKIWDNIILSQLGIKLSKENMGILFMVLRTNDNPFSFLQYGFAFRVKTYSFYLPIKDYYDFANKDESEPLLRDAFYALVQGKDYKTVYDNYILPPAKVTQEQKQMKIPIPSINTFLRTIVRKMSVDDVSQFDAKLKIKLGDIFPIKMFYEFIEHGARTFSVYKFPDGVSLDTLYGSEAFPKFDYRQVPFDKSKSFYEVVRNISEKLGRGNYRDFRYLEKLKLKIRDFVKMSYDPLNFTKQPKHRSKK